MNHTQSSVRRPPAGPAVRHMLRGSSRRQGAALVMVMVSLFVASLILATLVETVLRQQRQLRQERHRAQSQWCAEAGLHRALARWRADANYTGETWSIEFPQAGGETESRRQAEVLIQVASAGSELRVEVVAEYPLGAVHRVRTRRELWQPVLSTPVEAESSLSALEPENLQP